LRYVLAFFRDTLNGTTYFVVAFVCLILICFCIYILKRISLSEKELLKKEMESKVVLVDSSGCNGKIEVSLNDEVETGTQTITNVTSVLANQDIYSDNVTTDTLSTTSESTVEEKKEEVSEKKAPIMINPDEVALVSSDMNLIGSSEKIATINGSNSATLNVVSSVNTENVNNISNDNNSGTITEQQ